MHSFLEKRNFMFERLVSRKKRHEFLLSFRIFPMFRKHKIRKERKLDVYFRGILWTQVKKRRVDSTKHRVGPTTQSWKNLPSAFKAVSFRNWPAAGLTSDPLLSVFLGFPIRDSAGFQASANRSSRFKRPVNSFDNPPCGININTVYSPSINNKSENDERRFAFSSTYSYIDNVRSCPRSKIDSVSPRNVIIIRMRTRIWQSFSFLTRPLKLFNRRILLAWIRKKRMFRR